MAECEFRSTRQASDGSRIAGLDSTKHRERFVYDGEDLTLVDDETSTPALEGRYLHGPGIDTVLAYWEPGQKIPLDVHRPPGNVRDIVLINGSSGPTETAAAGTDVPS